MGPDRVGTLCWGSNRGRAILGPTWSDFRHLGLCETGMEMFRLVVLPDDDSETLDFTLLGPFSSNVALIDAVNSRRGVASHPRGVV